MSTIHPRSGAQVISRLPTTFEQDNEPEHVDRFGFVPSNYLFWLACLTIVIVLFAAAHRAGIV